MRRAGLDFKDSVRSTSLRGLLNGSFVARTQTLSNAPAGLSGSFVARTTGGLEYKSRPE